MARANKSSPNFEHSLSELQNLVARLEHGELSLEEALTCFEQGVRLTRVCQDLLQKAEQRVHGLLESNAPQPPRTTDPDI